MARGPGWARAAAVRRGNGMCARRSRRLSRAGRSRESDAGGVRPPAGRPHGAEQRRGGLHPVPRPHSAVREPGRRGPSSGGARRGAMQCGLALSMAERRCCASTGRGAGGAAGAAAPEAPARRGGWPSGSGAAGVPELQSPPSGAAVGGGGGARGASSESISQLVQRCAEQVDTAGIVTAITPLLSALVPVPASSMKIS